MGIIGAYMTPFFLGQQGVWDFALSYNSFLVYFLGINYLYSNGQINEFSLALFIAIVGFSIYALANTSQAFEKHENTYFAFGAVLPLVWFIGNVLLSADFSSWELFVAFGIIAIIYFGSWYALRDSIKKQEYISLYIGGLIAIMMMILSFQKEMEDYIGLVIGFISLIFGALYLFNPLKQRLMSFFGMAILGGGINALIFVPEY
jgi:hypothetical protein